MFVCLFVSVSVYRTPLDIKVAFINEYSAQLVVDNHKDVHDITAQTQTINAR